MRKLRFPWRTISVPTMILKAWEVWISSLGGVVVVVVVDIIVVVNILVAVVSLSRSRR